MSKTGAGTGTVTSAPAGISCGTTCSAAFASGTAVTLTAAPATGSSFTGWSGGSCSGTGTCTVTLSAATTVSAAFAALPPTLSLAFQGKLRDKVGKSSTAFSPDGRWMGPSR